MNDLERIKWICYVGFGGILLLAVFLGTYMIMWHVQDARQADRITSQLDDESGNGL